MGCFWQCLTYTGVQTHTHTQHSHKCLGWRFGRRRSTVNPGQDLFSHSATASSSACLSAYLLTKELSLCHDRYHSMAIFHVIIWFSIHSLKRLREAVCPHYTQGQSNIKQKERVFCLARSRYQHLVWFQWAWLFVRCESLHSLSHFTAVALSCHRVGFCLFCKLHSGFVIQAVCSGSQSEQEHQFSCICMESYGDCNSDRIDFFFPLL